MTKVSPGPLRGFFAFFLHNGCSCEHFFLIQFHQFLCFFLCMCLFSQQHMGFSYLGSRKRSSVGHIWTGLLFGRSHWRGSPALAMITTFLGWSPKAGGPHQAKPSPALQFPARPRPRWAGHGRVHLHPLLIRWPPSSPLAALPPSE